MSFVSVLFVALFAAQFAVADVAQQAEVNQQKMVDYSRSLADTLRRSSSARERAMSELVLAWDTSDSLGPKQRGRLLRDAAQSAPQDILVQRIWAQVDDFESGCDARSPCPGRRAAQANLEPNNAVAWIASFLSLDVEHDETGVLKLLGEMSKSTSADDHYVETIQVWLKWLRARPAPADDGDPPMVRHAAIAYAVSAFPSYTPLFKACRRSALPNVPAQRFAACAAAGRVLRDKGDTLLTSLMGTALVRASGAENEQDRVARRRIRWLQQSSGPENSSAVEDRQQFADLLSTGSEIQSLHRHMTRLGIPLDPPANWDPATDK